MVDKLEISDAKLGKYSTCWAISAGYKINM